MRKVLLIERYPDLAEQVVDRELVKTLGVSSRDKVLWRCDKGHEWEATVNNRVQKGRGCPYCSGRYAIPGENDLGTVRPDIAAQLVDKSLASSLKPTSHQKVEWRCENGHTWLAPVSSRVGNGSGCPYCSGRRAWPGETDLATTHPDLAAQLVDQSLATQLSRGSNKEVDWHCPSCGHEWKATVNARVHMGAGCPKCAGKVLVRGENDLWTLYPDIAAQMVDQELAKRTFVYSNKVVAWRCDKGHEWSASVSSRTRQGDGCPYCSGSRTLVGENDLATLRPDLVTEMVNPDDAIGLHPTSHKYVTWKCPEGHVWDGIVSNRVRFGYGCPTCAAARQQSDTEVSFANMVASVVGDDSVKRSDRTILSGRELDVLLDDLHVAFEFNGVYWHSSARGPEVMYGHLDKAEECLRKGIEMFVVWEDDWLMHREAVSDYVRLVLGKLPVLSDVTVEELSEPDAMAFCVRHSLDRECSFAHYVGVFHEGTCVAVVGGTCAGEGVLEARVLGLTCDLSEVMGSVLLELGKVAGIVGSFVVQTSSDRGYESADFYRRCGFSLRGYGDVRHYVVHASDPWSRDALESEWGKSRLGESGFCEICDSGSLLWQMMIA
jgi:DNA-directed RNA polymerase subunit RPC12/RpoP